MTEDQNKKCAARRSDWKTEPMPERHDTFTLHRSFSDAEMAAHRSWTGYCIYRIDFQEDHRHIVTVNRDPEQYSCTSVKEDRKTLNQLLDRWTQTPYDYDQAWLSETYDALKRADPDG